MNKDQLVKQVANDTKLSNKDVDLTINQTLEVIMHALTNGDKVTLHGFGSFENRTRAARKGRNPQTGEEMQIPESKRPVFSAGKKFKDALNCK
ncbi:HU family DNA-binding protein [Paenibacillus chitinolyticus]|uniref:HU family DNA-binding protein n=1 Tax=Paenibacillus chitinolyticus TaxID=79263 RepID=UPI0035592424